MPKPLEDDIDFLIIGAAKCATTWLQQSMSQTPQIFMPAPELHYFSREYARGVDWYRSQFAGREAATLVGEKSNSYLSAPDAAERIARDCGPQVKLVVQMRDPVERAYSDYCMLFRRGSVDDDIWVHLDPDRAARGRFLDDGRYAHHLGEFYVRFPAENILLLSYEDMRQAPDDQLAAVCDHIGFDGILHPPLSARVKDRDAPVVPRTLRGVLKPLRPVLDPMRGSWPMRALRERVARRVSYPALPEDLAQRMGAFFRSDVAALEARAPGISRRWRRVTGEPAAERAVLSA